MISLNITKNLYELLHEWIPDSQQYQNLLIKGLTNNSQQVKPNYLFFATIGFNVDGRQYIDDAIKNGAIAIICEDDCVDNVNSKSLLTNQIQVKFSPIFQCDIPIFYIKNLSYLIGFVAERFYDYPSKDLTLIGITGTNGKTSCCHFIAHLCNELGLLCGIIGTVGAGFMNNLTTLNNTTPDAITLQSYLAWMKAQGANVVAMEVSSQALVQNRLNGIRFDIAVFTNLTRDHIGCEAHCHKDMNEYGEAKRLLFANKHLKYAVLNLDDDFSQFIANKLDGKIEVCFYSIQSQHAGDYLCKLHNFNKYMYSKNIQIYPDGFGAEVVVAYKNNIGKINENAVEFLRSKLLGMFNLSNLLASISVMQCLGFNVRDILERVSLLNSVDGRMHVFRGTQKATPLIVVDYAHTPDALEKALIALREHCQGKIWCVFGCGGDRDRGKRLLMGEIAERLSNHVILTNDNPRTENPEQIMNDIMQGIVNQQNIYIEYDRSLAIAYAITNANINDVVLVAGKGHEDYQIIGTVKYPCNDAIIVQEYLINYLD